MKIFEVIVKVMGQVILRISGTAGRNSFLGEGDE